MDLKWLIKKLALGAFVGCFIFSLVEILITLSIGPSIASFSGTEIINGVLGSIVVGFSFALSSYVYNIEDIAFPLQVLCQMGIGMFVLFMMAIYLKWIPIDLGIMPILTWVAIACVFATVFWLGFYLYYSLEAKNLNDKINSVRNSKSSKELKSAWSLVKYVRNENLTKEQRKIIANRLDEKFNGYNPSPDEVKEEIQNFINERE